MYIMSKDRKSNASTHDMELKSTPLGDIYINDKGLGIDIMG